MFILHLYNVKNVPILNSLILLYFGLVEDWDNQFICNHIFTFN